MEQCRENEAAIVTGASSGIGATISARLCKMGYEVFGIGRSFGSSFAEQFRTLQIIRCFMRWSAIFWTRKKC